MANDILFIDCVNARRIISLGPYYLQASLKQHGYGASVVPVPEDGEDAALDGIVAARPRVIGFSVDISNVAQSARCAEKLRRRTNALIIAGGPQVTLEKRQFMVDYPHFDLLCIGEGEQMVLELVRAVEAGGGVAGIPGTLYRSNGKIQAMKDRPLLEELDALAFPDYDNMPFNGHIHPVITSRGCPYDCVFCCTKTLYGSRQWRARSPENVIAELKDVKARGFRRVGIWDDAFNTDIRRAKRIMQLAIDEQLGLEFSFPNGVRANCLDDELVSLMRRAGVVRIPFGVEDLDETVARGIGKNLKPEALKTACEHLHRHGYRTEAFMIIGLPGATYASTLRSLAKLEWAGIDLARWYIAVPYTNTELHRWVQESAIPLEGEYGTGTWSSNPPVLFETTDFRKAERLKAFYECNAEMNNFLVLGGEARRSKPMVAAVIAYRLLKYRPKKVARFLQWLVAAATNPMKALFNEPFRRLTRAEVAAIARHYATERAPLKSPRTTTWLGAAKRA
jgi:radical SAM superfamily enzyme YgiQ (UPF0313 family)